MFHLLVLQAVILVVSSELYVPHAEYVQEYAPTYHNYKPRDYEFNYGVSDPFTGDHKSQWEVKQNGVVRGGYSLLEPDGTTRLVNYIADDGGFRAVVNKLGTAVHSATPIVSQYGTYSGQYNNYYAQAVPQYINQQSLVTPQVSILPQSQSPITTKSIITHSSPIVPEYNSYQQNLYGQAAPEISIAPQIQSLPILSKSGISHSTSIVPEYSPYQQSLIPQGNPEVSIVPQLQVQREPVYTYSAPQTAPINQQYLSSEVPQYGDGQQIVPSSSPQPFDYNIVPELELKQNGGQQLLPDPNIVEYDRYASVPLPRPIGNSVDASYTPNYSESVPSNGLSPIGPSYVTNIQYDGYAAAYSQDVPHLVPAPITKRTANLKPAPPSGPQGKFLIYVPESESD